MITKTTSITMYDNDSDWISRLYNLPTQHALWICTYSLPRSEYTIPSMIRNHPKVILVCNPTANKVIERAYKLKQQHPTLRIIMHPKVHAKMVLIGGYSFISTENFGANGGWFERTIGIRDQDVYDQNLRDLNNFLRSSPGIEVELNQPISAYYNRFQVLYPH